MQITRVRLENIKSYKEAEVEFAGGTIAICGQNGAGKTTLLEAIGCTLFAFGPLPKAEDFVRQGERNGSVTLTLLANDEREYEIVRRFGRNAGYTVYDPALSKKLAEGKADTLKWLCRQLGVSSDADLESLFSNAIGVPQGLLTAVFLEAAAERKATFNPLLRVDEYDKAKDELLQTERYLKDQIAETQMRIADLAARVESLPQVESRLADVRQQIEADTRQAEALQAGIAGLVAEVERWQAQLQTIERLRLEVERLEERRQDAGRALQEARQRLAEARQAQADKERSSAGHAAYLRAQETLRQLERDRNQRDAEARRLADVQRKLAGASERLKSAEAQLADIERAAARRAEIAPLVAKQRELEAARDDLSVAAGRLADLTRTAQAARQALQELQDEIEQTDMQIEKLADLLPLAERRAALQAERDHIASELAALQAALGSALQSREAVAGGLCPFLHEACRNIAEGTSLTDHFERQIAGLQHQRAGLDDKLKAVEKDLDAARHAENQTAGLPALRDRRALLERRRGAAGAHLAELEGQIAGLADAPRRLAEVQAELAELGDYRQEDASLEGLLRRRPATEAAQQAAMADEAKLRAAAQEIENQLAAYAGLDERIAALRNERDAYEQDYTLYLKSEALANTVESCEQAERGHATMLAQIERELAGRRAEQERAEAGYDAAQHASRQAELAQAHRDAATLAERLRLNTDMQTELEGRLQDLRQRQKDLEALQEEEQADLRLQQFVREARDIIGRAGPRVTAALVSEIARHAAEIFAELMGDHTLHLQWTDNYEIRIEQAGEERSFRQLSGGEQMAAAIAVRLALLRRITDVDIAFFDEPTANLDATRRESLADQIMALRGFSQIFVISHDDTFERVTDQIIRVVKEDGTSYVQVG